MFDLIASDILGSPKLFQRLYLLISFLPQNIRVDDLNFKVDLIWVVVKGVSLLVCSGTTQDNFRNEWKFVISRFRKDALCFCYPKYISLTLCLKEEHWWKTIFYRRGKGMHTSNFVYFV